MFSHKLNRTLGLIILFTGALLWTSSIQSAPGSLATSPIFTNSNVPPNVFFEVDDSGSMDFEVMTSSHWSYCAYDRDATGNAGNGDCGYRVISGHSSISTTNFDEEDWQSEVLNIFDEPDNLYYDLCINTLDNCSNTETMVDWRLYSTDLNTVYYDPSIEYKPWYGASFSNASFISALSNPQPGSNGYADSGGTPITRNLSNGITTGANTGFIYEIWQDTHGYSGTRPRRGSNINRNTTSNNEVDLWDNHTRYYVQLSQIVEQSISYTVSSTGTLTENIVSTTTYSGSDTLNGRTIAEVQQNIANWYQYSRRRSFVTKGALGKVITENPENRYGLNFINNSSFDYNSGSSSFINVPTGLSGFSSHNNSLLQGLYDLEWAALSTPLRDGLDRAGQYFDDSSSSAPIEYECQQNFAVLLTDGYWNGTKQSTSIGNQDGDSHSDTIADIAKYYYDEDLSTKPNNVPPNSEDLKTTQHLVTFPVAFGVNGLLPDADNDGWPEDSSSVKLTESGDWGDPESSDTTPEKIDDLWHAAFNSKGRFASASTPVELENALANAIGSAGSLRGSVAAVNFNTTSLSSDTDVYVAEFDKTDNLWAGDLTSYDLDPTSGAIATSSNWTAATQLDALATPVSSRKIITYNNATGNGIPFQWTNLTTNQKDDLKKEPNGSSSDITKAQAKLNFLRGDRSNEQLNPGSYTFRNRASLLGDIVNSAPAFVKLPDDDWPAISPFPSTTGEKYSDFQSTQSARDGVIYVGANDGMLHGFSEATGEELISYIPNYSFSDTTSSEGLHFLTDLNYQHRFYVDLSPIVSDVYIDKVTSGGSNKHWVSLLVGGSRAGGKGIFALDVTNPGSFSEANAADIVLWEFSDADDVDLGFIFSPPTIAMMNNGRWAAIFGNGYNNKGDGKAKLFIVFLDGGVDGVWTPTTDYIEIDTGVGTIVSNDCLDSGSDCNGLSIPEAVDLDGNHTIDRVYAGDIKGNLWAFDLSDATASNWGSAYPTSGGTAKPLFIASSNQPIMDKPITVKHPDIADSSSPSNAPNRLVFFGTGQYLSNSDVTTVPGTQSFYGVWDHGTKEITPANLFEQHFDTSTTFFDNEDDCATATGPCTDTDNNLTNSIRVFNNDLNSNGTIEANEMIDYLGTPQHQGWKINLTLLAGERVIYNPRVYDGLVIFETIIPEAIACSTGGSGYLMVVNQKDGGAPDINDPAFDLSGDGDVDSDDLVKDSTNNTSSVVGKRREHGMGGQSNMQDDKLYTSITDGGVEIDSFRVSSNLGRLSWQELR